MREIKDDDLDDRARYGIVLGPPEFDELDHLSVEVRRSLNNELFARGIITVRDAVRRRSDVESALRSALRLDVETIMAAFVEG